MPKLVMNASGDQYFLPDSSQFYFDDLPGPKYLRYVPNADHSLAGSDAYLTLLSWHDAIIHHRALPTLSWKLKEDGQLTASTGTKPSSVLLWEASNPNGRDFRVETVGKIWKSSPLSEVGTGTYVYTASTPKPATGWAAYFIELTFDLGGPAPLKLTTPVRIVPDTLPYAVPVFQPPSGYLHK